MFEYCILFLGFILSCVIIWRDWQFYEIDDREMIPLILLGLFWSCFWGGGFLFSCIVALLFSVAVALIWFKTRHRDVPAFGDGDIMLVACLGFWGGFSHLLMFLYGMLFFILMTSIANIPRTYLARKRKAGGRDPNLGDVYRPVQYNVIPLAPPVLLSIIFVHILSIFKFFNF